MNILSKLKNYRNKKPNPFPSARFLANKRLKNKSDYDFLLHDAFLSNVIVNRGVSMIAKNIASAALLLYRQSKNDHSMIELQNHPILSMLSGKSGNMRTLQTIESIVSYYLIAGNCFIYAIKNDFGKISELQILRPELISIETNSDGHPINYIYETKNNTHLFPIDQATGNSDILHIKNFNPSQELYGSSPLLSCADSIKQYNESIKWNRNLISNGARPSGALVYKNSGPDGHQKLTDEQFNRIKSQIQRETVSPSNAGKILLLEGGMEWQEMSINPKDMDFLETKNSAARDISLSLGVFPQLLGIKGDATYNNMEQAKMALWEETCIPILEYICKMFSGWFSYHFQDSLMITYDKESISSLTGQRKKMWEMVNSANFLSESEKREMLGFSEKKPK